MSEKKLTVKQQLFVENYLISGNATDAARKAGYKGNDKTLQMVGYQNLLKPIILETIEKSREKKSSKLNITREEKQELLTQIMMNNNISLIKRDDDKPDKIVFEVDMKDRLKALELHCKMNGEFIQRVESVDLTHEEWLKRLKEDNADEIQPDKTLH